MKLYYQFTSKLPINSKFRPQPGDCKSSIPVEFHLSYMAYITQNKLAKPP